MAIRAISLELLKKLPDWAEPKIDCAAGVFSLYNNKHGIATHFTFDEGFPSALQAALHCLGGMIFEAEFPDKSIWALREEAKAIAAGQDVPADVAGLRLRYRELQPLLLGN